ncbi:MAG: TrkH family potassium uptake protein [Candidatus Omnitrophota bacterium]
MVLKPQIDDFKVIGYYLGKVVIGLGFFMLFPVMIGLLFREPGPVADFLLGFFACVILGNLFIIFCRTEKDLAWMHGMVVVSLSWIVAALLAAMPLFLSGHWLSFLDASFDAMSGFATTGLVLVQDLDHLSYAHNFWRHLIMFMGGQGIMVVALTFLVRGISGAFKMYVGEARDERVLPNIIETARFIWLVSLVYLVLGTLALGIAGWFIGMSPGRAFFHGACIFMAAFDTGGFTPQSQNILYYHSLGYEIVTVVIMLLGAINFKLHHALWTGNRKEIVRNIETVTLFVTVMITFFLVAFDLAKMGVYPEILAIFRKGFYQLISGHTGTGYQTIYAQQFIREWGQLALVGIVGAMMIGGSACSTTGGFKVLRLGVVAKAFIEDIRRIMLPEGAISHQKFHHIKAMILEEKQVRSVALILLAYLILYFGGAIVGMLLGYPFMESLFESTSAAANVGLSCGITAASMPAALKIVYIIQMWAGRLEFMSVFALLALFVAWVKGR